MFYYRRGLLFGALLATNSLAQAPQLPDPLAAGWQGQKTCEKMHEDESVRILRCVFPPGVGHERHFHAPGYTYTLASGKVRITDASGTRDAEVKAGAGRFSGPIAWHELLNVGESTVAFLVVEPKLK